MDDYRPYEEDSWDAWDRVCLLHYHRMGREGSGAYLPSPQEIEERKSMLRWLQSQDFSNRLIEWVMVYDHPGFGLVKKLVDKYGPEEAERRLSPFILKETSNDHSEPSP